MEIEQFYYDSDIILGEGPHYCKQSDRLIFNDIMGKSFSIVDYTKRKLIKKFNFENSVTAVVPKDETGDIVVVAHGASIEEFNTNTEEKHTVAHIEYDETGRFNDAKCDVKGRLWTGTMPFEKEPGVVPPMQGACYMLDTNGTIHKKFGDVCISNGLAWSPDNKTFYYIDSLKRTVDAFDYEVENGEISNRRIAINFSTFESKDHLPDGMCIDEEGMLWIALFNGYKVVRCNPLTGEKLLEIKFPVKQVTSCAFAGQNYDELIVTTAKFALKPEEIDEQLLAGTIYRIKNLGVKGIPPFIYCG